MKLANRSLWMSADGRVGYTRSAEGWGVWARGTKHGGRASDMVALCQVGLSHRTGPLVRFGTRREAIEAVQSVIANDPPEIRVCRRKASYVIVGATGLSVLRDGNQWRIKSSSKYSHSRIHIIQRLFKDAAQREGCSQHAARMRIETSFSKFETRRFPTRRAAIDATAEWLVSHGWDGL